MARNLITSGKTMTRDTSMRRVLLPPGTGGGGNFPQFVPPLIGYNSTDVADIPVTTEGSNTWSVIVLPADKIAWGLAQFISPAGYTGTVTISMVVWMLFSETMIFRTTIVDTYGPPAADSTKWPDGAGGSETETVTSTNTGLYAVARNSKAITAQTFFQLQGVRRGTDAGDVSAEEARLFGFLIEYA